MGKDAKPKPVQLKVFIDNKKKKVMFAEAEEDFVEILFSFLTLPLGTIAKLSNKHGSEDSKDVKCGSLSSLYESVENLDNKHFSNEHCKTALVNPNSSSVSLCEKLKVNLTDDKKPQVDGVGEPIFVQKKASFIITDDLNVLPVLLDRSIALLNSLGVQYIDLLEERTILNFGFKEFSDLLKWSLVTDNPLTNLVIGASKPCSCLSCIKSSNLPLVLGHSTSESQTIKLLVQKSTNKVLCAQVDNFFVEMLFSFLTIPSGTVKRMTSDNSSSMGIDKLYDSISRLADGKYLKSEETKTMLLRPKIAANYLRVTDLLPIYEKDASPGSFLKEQATFIVSDDLAVTVSPSLSIISKFNTLGVPVGDIEVMEVSIGEQEALLILKASLTSTSPLTSCMNAFKKAKSLT